MDKELLERIASGEHREALNRTMKALEESPVDILLIHDHIIAMKAAGYDLLAITLQEIFRMVHHGVDFKDIRQVYEALEPPLGDQPSLPPSGGNPL